MPVVMIGDFGKNSEGIHTYSINATKKDEIYEMIDQVRGLGYKFWETPNLTYKARTWHVLLKIYIPKQLGYPEESSNG